MNTPNILSISRIFLSPFIFLSIKYPFLFLPIFIIGTITDTLDGYLARKLKQESKLGKKLDANGDLFFYTSSILTLILIKPIIFTNHKIPIIIITSIGLIQLIIRFIKNNFKTKHYLISKLSAIILFITVITNGIKYNPLTINLYLIIITLALIEGILPLIKNNNNKLSYFIKTK